MPETGWDIGLRDRRFNTALADRIRPLEEKNTVDQVRIEKALRYPCATLDEKGGNATRAERFQQLARFVGIGLQHFDAGIIERGTAGHKGLVGIFIEGRRMTGNGDHRILPRRLHELATERKLKLVVNDDAQRRSIFQARQAASQFRIVGDGRADADQDGVAFGANDLHLGAGDIAGDTHLPCARLADHPVCGNGKLESHIRPVSRLAHEIAGKRVPALFLENTDIDLDPRIPQHRDAAPGNALIGISNADDDTGDAIGDERLEQGGVLP